MELFEFGNAGQAEFLSWCQSSSSMISSTRCSVSLPVRWAGAAGQLDTSAILGACQAAASKSLKACLGIDRPAVPTMSVANLIVRGLSAQACHVF